MLNSVISPTHINIILIIIITAVIYLSSLLSLHQAAVLMEEDHVLLDVIQVQNKAGSPS